MEGVGAEEEGRREEVHDGLGKLCSIGRYEGRSDRHLHDGFIAATKVLLPSEREREAAQYRRKQVGLPHGEVLVKGREGKFCSFT